MALTTGTVSQKRMNLLSNGLGCGRKKRRCPSPPDRFPGRTCFPIERMIGEDSPVAYPIDEDFPVLQPIIFTNSSSRNEAKRQLTKCHPICDRGIDLQRRHAMDLLSSRVTSFHGVTAFPRQDLKKRTKRVTVMLPRSLPSRRLSRRQPSTITVNYLLRLSDAHAIKKLKEHLPSKPVHEHL